MRSTATRYAQQVGLPVLLLAIVWVVTASSPSLYFPSLQKVFVRVWTQLTEGRMPADLAFSLKNLLVGFLLGAVAAVAVGIVVGLRRRLDLATRPLLNFARATPQLAFVPVLILALGLGSAPKVFAIALATFWPVLLNTVQGVRGINPAVVEASRAFRIPTGLLFRKVVVPGASPQIFAGLRIGLSVGIIVTVVSEMYGSTEGIGFFVLQSGQKFAILDTWAGTLVIGVLGYLLSLLMLVLENLVLGWHRQRAPRRRGAPFPAAAPTPTSPATGKVRI